MQHSPLLDEESAESVVAVAAPPSPPPRDAGVRVLANSIRQRSVELRTGRCPGSASEDSPLTFHVGFRGYVDALWVYVTEGSNVAPGVIMCSDDSTARGGAMFKYNGETPAVECEVLLGMRDHPLTNLIAGTIVHAVRSFGEARTLLLCVNVARTAKALEGVDEKRELLRLIRETVMELAKGGGQ